MEEKKLREKKKTVTELAPETDSKYVPPKIVTYTSEQIMEQIGPAQACSPFG